MIKLVNVNKIHVNRKNQTINALKNINLELAGKGLVLVVGANGSGKSTLLSVLGGLDRITSGKIIVNGKEFSCLSQKKLDDWRGNDVAYVFQEYNMLSDYTVAENIAMGKSLLGEKVTDDEINAVLKKINMQGFNNRRLKDLSGGEKQRVSVARALIKSPRVVLVDEPVAHADEPSAKIVLKLLQELSKDVLVVAVSHNKELFTPYADRVITMDDGIITSDTYTKGRARKPFIASEDSIDLSPLNCKDNTFKLKSKSTAFNMGVKTFFKNWKKSMLPVVLTAFSLLFFATSMMLSNFQRYQALATDGLNTTENYYYFSGNRITQKEGQVLKDALGERQLINFLDYNTNGISGIIEVPQEGVLKTVLGQDILYRDGASKTEGMFGNNNDKVMITDYLANKIINNALTVYTSTGVEHPVSTPLRVDKLADGNKYIRLGFPYKYFSISGIVATNWERDLPTSHEQFKYNMIYAPVGFTKAHLHDDMLSTIHINGSGGFKGRVITSGQRPSGASVVRLDNEDKNQTLKNGEIIVSNNLWVSIGRPTTTRKITFSIFNNSSAEYRVVGYYENGNPDREITIEMNAASYTLGEYAALQTNYPTTKLLFLTETVNSQKLAQIISAVENNTSLTFRSAQSENINDFANKLEWFKSVLLAFGGFSLLLSAAFLYYFITCLIQERRRDIGIFRALGARSSTVMLSFFTTVTIITACAFVLATALSFITMAIINGLSPQLLGVVGCSIANVKLVHVVMMFVACAIAALVATLLPLINYANQTPIKQIKR